MRLLLIHNRLLDLLGRLFNLFLHAFSRSSSLVRHAIGLHSIRLRNPILLGRDIDLMAAIVANEIDEILDGAGAGVVDGLVLGAGFEELDGGEALDLVRDVVGGRIDFGDDNFVGKGLVHLGKLVVFRGQSFAVAAPGGVEFKEDVFVVVDDDVLVVFGDDDGDGAFLLFGDRLALDARLELAGDVVVDEGADVLGADVFGAALFGIGELEVLGGVLDGESGPGASLKVEIRGVLAEGGGVDGGKVHLALVLLGDGLEVLGEGLALLGSLREDVSERNARL